MRLQSWLLPSWTRAFPTMPAPKQSGDALTIWAARGERLAFQVCYRHDFGGALPATLAVQAPAGVRVRVRRVGCVPVPHHNQWLTPQTREGNLPGFVPDVLFDETTALTANGETAAFWVTVTVAPSAAAGRKALICDLTVGRDKTVKKARLTAQLQVAPVTIGRRKNFPVTHWFYADAIADWYGVAPFSRDFWPICARYFKNFADHGSDLIYVPVFTPPLDGVKRPTQLLGVTRTGPDRYRFDWTQVQRWIATARRAGLRKFEWSHLFTQWGVKYALRIYHGHGETAKLLWSPTTGATSPTYRKFLAQFLTELKRFLDREGLLKHSFFHVSDEPHGTEALENYRRARRMLNELAPWMQVMDALSDIEFGRQKLTDMPIPSIKTALQFKAEGIPSWCYYCCSPNGRFTNRFMDTPLPNVRAQGILFYRHRFGGFLHWGYNYWYKRQSRQLIDPFQVNDGGAWPGWTHGDPFVVYPGGGPISDPQVGGIAPQGGLGAGVGRIDGPLDSIRWEIFAETLQDYALLQTLGVDPDDQRLATFKTFEDFPHNGRAVTKLRESLLKATGKR